MTFQPTTGTQTSMFDPPTEKFVRKISYDETKPFLLGVHYARRMPCITDAFGLFLGGKIIGVVTYGVPASRPLCIGLAGEENADMVRELNRLCILPEYNGKNYASFLVSHSLKMLPKGTFVVSYADTAWSHVGYIYQAANFLYTGLSARRNDTYQPGGGTLVATTNLITAICFKQDRASTGTFTSLVASNRKSA